MRKLKRILSVISATAVACTMPIFSSLGEKENAAGLSAIELVDDMGMGINLGNTFDCHGASTKYFGTGGGASGTGWIPESSWNANSTETAWGNPVTTKAMIDAIHAAGFDSIRIPVTWFENSDPVTHDIDDAFLARVKEVVDYAYSNGMYVIINMHWDWANASADQLKYFQAQGKESAYWLTKGMDALPQFKTMWTEIANYFKDYDNHLVFEDMNEVTFDYDTLNTFNSSFVDLVRATGGNNKDRLLLLAGANDDLSKTCSDKYIVPDDKMVAVTAHYYYPTPWAVATVSDLNAPGYWGYQGTWGTDEDKQYVYEQFAKMKAYYVDRGIPVILGEYGVVTDPAAGKDPDDIVEYLKTIASSALSTEGVAAYLWDAGDAGDMKTFSRKSMQFTSEDNKNVYTNLKKYGSPLEFTYDIKKNVQTTDRVTIPLLGSGDYSIDLGPYAAANVKQVILEGTAGAGWGVSFPATNPDGSNRNWTSEAGQTGSDGKVTIDIDGIYEGDNGSANYVMTMAGSMNFQKWWGTEGAVLKSVTLVFDKTTTFTDYQISVTAKEKDPGEMTEATTAPPTQTTTTTTTTTTAITTTVTSTEPTTEVTTGDKIGDVNGDGEFGLADIVMLQKWLSGALTDVTNPEEADMNNDGNVNVFDLVIMERTYLGYID